MGVEERIRRGEEKKAQINMQRREQGSSTSVPVLCCISQGQGSRQLYLPSDRFSMRDGSIMACKGIERRSNEGIGLKAIEKGDEEWMMETRNSSNRGKMKMSTWCFMVKQREIFIQSSITV